MKRQWRIFGNYKLHWSHLAVTHYLHRLQFFGRLAGSIHLLPFCPCLVSLQTLPSTQWVQLKKKGRRGGGDGRQGKEGREKARSRWKRSERRNWVSSLKFLNEQWQGECSFPVGGPWGGERGLLICSGCRNLPGTHYGQARAHHYILRKWNAGELYNRHNRIKGE